MDKDLIFIVIIFTMLISNQYTLNLILKEIRDIKKLVERQVLNKDSDNT